MLRITNEFIFNISCLLVADYVCQYLNVYIGKVGENRFLQNNGIFSPSNGHIGIESLPQTRIFKS